MKNASQWSDRLPPVSKLLREWDKSSLNRLQILVERLIIESKEETVSLAANPNVRAPEVRVAAGGHRAYERLLSLVKGAIRERENVSQ